MGQTIQTTGRVTVEELDVPQVVFCTKFPFKTDVLSGMGLRDTVFSSHFHTYNENVNITDINQVWEKGTYSMNELSIGWTLMYGM